MCLWIHICIAQLVNINTIFRASIVIESSQKWEIHCYIVFAKAEIIWRKYMPSHLCILDIYLWVVCVCLRYLLLALFIFVIFLLSRLVVSSSFILFIYPCYYCYYDENTLHSQLCIICFVQHSFFLSYRILILISSSRFVCYFFLSFF